MPARRKSPREVTPFLIEQIGQLSRDLFQDEIAARLGCSMATVSRVQRRNGFPHFTRAHRRARVRAA
jgi:DNA-binding MurR/RpiR family transcriptional regulator